MTDPQPDDVARERRQDQVAMANVDETKTRSPDDAAAIAEAEAVFAAEEAETQAALDALPVVTPQDQAPSGNL